MKKNILNKKVFLWLIVHLSILLLFLFRFNHRAKIETNFLSIAPKFEESGNFQNSIETFFLQNSSEIKILVESEDFDKAKNSAIEIENYIKEIFQNVSVNLYSKNYDDILETIIKYKYQLISKDIRNALLNNQASRVAEEGIANFYSPFFIPIVDNIEDDPFFVLNSKFIELLQNNNNIETRDGINFINYEGKFNVSLNMDIPKKFNGMIFFDDLTESLKKIENNENVKIYISGVPIHAYYSQKSAQREITIISAVSLIFICLIFLFIFKSVKPYIISMISIAVSSATSFFLLSIILDSIHIFTFVFGTSLIGISLDYSIHFITEWYNEKDKKEVLKKIFPSMSLSFMTTIASYFALSLTSLSLLKQTALFSIFGLASSFLTVIIIYPIIFKNDYRFLRKNILNKTKNILASYVNFLNIKFVLILIILVALISILNIPKLKVNFSSNQLYNPPDFLSRNETEIYKRLNSSLSRNIIISRGESLDDALENEEILENYFTNYSALSKIFYSKSRQIENIKLVEDNLMPLLKKQTEDLGFDDEIYNKIKSEFENNKNEFLNIEDLIENMSELKKLIVKNDGKYFIISTTDEIETKIIENENIKIFNINSEINETLDKTAKTAIKTALIAYVIIFFFMIIFLSKKHAFAIIIIQIISILVNLSVHSIFNLNVNIFSVFALILSIGISIDYCIFFSKSKAKKEVTFLSIFLAMITTALSFGTLSFSGFIPVKSFGLFLFIGILVTFLLSPILLTLKSIKL
ncbi:MMPL family transporter [Brachyspira catarrhinii]|uniref:Membrane transport protein MMPL domain-containing protein n=1 Tax=Brachyspira catarrhinii TaxID=2528966 RepID=A0ABY2TWL2_9SPIR|nr:MMPL family transporter [Brachyspira catarrhinii]TKZ36311.1 hypothetical protein EZH24_00720 [Brachyspira catarrhinii]